MAKKENAYKNGMTSKEIYEYNKRKYSEIHLRIPKENKRVMRKLDTVPSKNGYILGLIEEDIEKNG